MDYSEFWRNWKHFAKAMFRSWSSAILHPGYESSSDFRTVHRLNLASGCTNSPCSSSCASNLPSSMHWVYCLVSKQISPCAFVSGAIYTYLECRAAENQRRNNPVTCRDLMVKDGLSCIGGLSSPCLDNFLFLGSLQPKCLLMTRYQQWPYYGIAPVGTTKSFQTLLVGEEVFQVLHFCFFADESRSAFESLFPNLAACVSVESSIDDDDDDDDKLICGVNVSKPSSS